MLIFFRMKTGISNVTTYLKIDVKQKFIENFVFCFVFCPMQLWVFFRMKSETTNITVNMHKWFRFFPSNLFILSDGALHVLSNEE